MSNSENATLALVLGFFLLLFLIGAGAEVLQTFLACR